MPEKKKKERAPRKPVQRPNKREYILLAAVSVMSHYGYKHTTVSMIAKEAGVSNSLMRHYMGNKNQIAALCARRICADTLRQIRRITETSASCQEQADRMLELVSSRQNELRLLLSLKVTQEYIIRDVLPEMEQVTQQLMSAYGEQSQGISHNLYALYLGFLLMGDKEQFEQARDSLLQQAQDRQALTT